MTEENYKETTEEKELAYDLRQAWVKIVGEHLLNVDNQKMNGSFANYYLALEYLFDRIHIKFNNRLEAIKKIDGLRKEIEMLANKYPSVWLGTGNGQKASSDIRQAIRRMDWQLLAEMEEANMFGAKYDDEGL